MTSEHRMHPEDKAWLDYRAKFAEVYDEANYSSPLQSAVMRASHRLTERPYDERTHFARVVEIGAGTGEHLPFVRHTFDEYTLNAAVAGVADLPLELQLEIAELVSRHDVGDGRVLGECAVFDLPARGDGVGLVAFPVLERRAVKEDSPVRCGAAEPRRTSSTARTARGKRARINITADYATFSCRNPPAAIAAR